MGDLNQLWRQVKTASHHHAADFEGKERIQTADASFRAQRGEKGHLGLATDLDAMSNDASEVTRQGKTNALNAGMTDLVMGSRVTGTDGDGQRGSEFMSEGLNGNGRLG
jgi:hypothetical protein